MNQYSESIGSFLRTGNYPLEANYIFPTEAALKEFYNDPINNATIHKGLLKIVEDGGDGKQALYWVIQNEDNLEFTRLIENLDVDNINIQLQELYIRLNKEIEDRAAADTELWGTNDTSEIPEGMSNIYELANQLSNLIKEVDSIHKELTDTDSILKTEIKAIAGTEEDDIVEYLKTLDYLNLTLVSETLHKFLNTIDNTDTSINTLPELKEFLRGFEHTHNLYECFVDFWNNILGIPTPNTQFRTLRGILDFVEALTSVSKNTDINIQEELNLTLIGVGLDSSGLFSPDKETNYLKDATSVMNALKTLDSLVHTALSAFVINVANKDIVPLEVTKTDAGYIIGASLDISNTDKNQLIKKTDGLYYGAQLSYDAGTVTFKVNDNIVSLFNIGISSILKLGYYNASNEEIVLEFNTHDGTSLIVRIPVGALIREWIIDNSVGTVELSKIEVINGPDKLSADVRISEKAHNILERDGNSLFVEGTSDAITYNSLTLTAVILDIITKAKTVSDKLDKEIQDRKDETASIRTDIIEKVSELNTSITEKVSDLNSAIINEKSERETSDNDIKNLITTNSNLIDSVSDLVDTVQTNLNIEILDRKDAILSLRDDFERETDNISSSITDINSKVNTNTSDIIALDLKLDNSINTAKSYTDTEILKEKTRATLAETSISNKIDSISINKLDTPEEGFKDTYYLSIAGNLIGSKINIPEDKVIKSATIKEVASINDPYLGANIGDKYIEFTFEGTVNNLYLPVNDIVIKYKEGNGINISQDNFISAKVFINDKYLENSIDGVKTKGIDDAINTAKLEVITLINDKAPIDSPILTGIPLVETSPDDNDSSQRIPSTNWVNARIAESAPTDPGSYWLKLTAE